MLSMAPAIVPEATACFGGAIPLETDGESRLSEADISLPPAVFEPDTSGLLLDDPIFGFPGGSLFPVSGIDVAVDLGIVPFEVDVSAQGLPMTDIADDSSSTISGTLIASSGSDGALSPRLGLRKIAPKPPDNHAPCLPVRAGVRKPAVKTKRAAFKPALLRAETSLTRTLNSCVRCRILRNRCSPNPNTIDGPCLTCMRATPKMGRLPCLRYKITESSLYRTAFQHFEFFRLHLMVGPTYGDFHIRRQWTQRKTKVLEFAQDSNVILQLRVREFTPTAEELLSDDTRGNEMYGLPWAIADPDEATRAVNLYIDGCVEAYLNTILDDSDHLVWDVFHWAVRLSVFPEPNILLSNVIRLWVACRFLEGRWRCCGGDTLGAEGLSHRYDRDPIIQVPPFINYQMAAIFTERILQPLRVTVLKQLQDIILAAKTSKWFVISLSVFILLHNYELQCRFHRAFAKRRKFPVRFVDMPIIRSIHSGAKTILAHFHYICKGQRPFSPETNWDSPTMKSMAQLDDEQIRFLKQYQDLVRRKAARLQAVSLTDDHEEEYWFISQMFDPDWVPRQTNEHSLLASPSV